MLRVKLLKTRAQRQSKSHLETTCDEVDASGSHTISDQDTIDGDGDGIGIDSAATTSWAEYGAYSSYRADPRRTKLIMAHGDRLIVAVYPPRRTKELAPGTGTARRNK